MKTLTEKIIRKNIIEKCAKIIVAEYGGAEGDISCVLELLKKEKFENILKKIS